jgi:CPA2 family monovalent cation:H+ antiporter-2
MEMNGHVIIAGYGPGGRFIAECLQERGIPFVIVELNEQTCERQKDLGNRVVYGDVRDETVLRAAGIETARVLALAVSDEQAAVTATEVASRIRPEVHIIASTRYTSTALQALKRGADEVIVAEQAVAFEFYRRIATMFHTGDGDALDSSAMASDACSFKSKLLDQTGPIPRL